MPVTVRGGDYSYEGEVVAVFRKRRGNHEVRLVVEDENGRLFIHNSNQVGPTPLPRAVMTVDLADILDAEAQSPENQGPEKLFHLDEGSQVKQEQPPAGTGEVADVARRAEEDRAKE